MEPGESKRVKVGLTPMNVGAYDVELKLQNNDEIIGGNVLFTILVEGDEKKGFS